MGKGVSSYEYVDEWEKLNGTSLPEKEDFYSHLNMEDIPYTDYAHAKIVCKDLRIKKCKGMSWFLCSKRQIIVSRSISKT